MKKYASLVILLSAVLATAFPYPMNEQPPTTEMEHSDEEFISAELNYTCELNVYRWEFDRDLNTHRAKKIKTVRLGNSKYKRFVLPFQERKYVVVTQLRMEKEGDKVVSVDESEIRLEDSEGDIISSSLVSYRDFPASINQSLDTGAKYRQLQFSLVCNLDD